MASVNIFQPPRAFKLKKQNAIVVRALPKPEDIVLPPTRWKGPQEKEPLGFAGVFILDNKQAKKQIHPGFYSN